MESTRCDLCRADDTEVLCAGDGWGQPVPEGLVLVRCRRCGLVYLNPRPAPDEIGRYYPQDYANYRPAPGDERFWLMRWMRQRKLAQRRRLVERYSGRRTGRILDVGCATGLFLDEMARAGWQAQGVELTGSAVRYARRRFGLEVFEGMLEDAPFAPGSFNAVTFWDVLEHTYSPAATLERTAELLRPGGLVAINVPNWHSFDRRLFGMQWIGFDPPRHLYVFSRTTLTALLRRAGFEPLAWVCFMPSYFSSIISLERWLGARTPRGARLASRVLNLPGMRLPFEPAFWALNRLQRGGVISVFARKCQPGAADTDSAR